MYTPTISQATKAAVVYDSGRPVSLRRVLRPYARARCETHPRQAADWEDVIAKRLSHTLPACLYYSPQMRMVGGSGCAS